MILKLLIYTVEWLVDALMNWDTFGKSPVA